VRSPEPTSVLVLSSEKWDLRRWEADELHAAVGEVGEVVPCLRPGGEALLGWLAREATALGIEMDRAAAAELADRTGEDSLALYRELQKLACHAGEGGRVSVEDVLALTGELAAPSIFHFLDVLFVERRRSRAMSLLSKLLREMHPLRLHTMLLSQLRKIIALKGACENNLSVGAVAAQVKLPVHLVSQLRLMAQRTPYGRFAELLRLLAMAEARLKRGGDGRQVLEGLVLECCK
jgi:DNA polymerase-3 subunit delta